MIPLTHDQVTELVRYWQAGHGLEVDGIAGPLTVASIEAARRHPPKRFLACPLPVLAGDRHAQVTSEFRPADRPNHNGVDLFYRWQAGDLPDFVGDHGGAGTVDGHPKWVVPLDTFAIAAAPGRVQLAGNSTTGYRVWIDHGNGWRTGYFHLTTCMVAFGEPVEQGTPLGLVGDNPADHDGRHLHFELSPIDRYAPVDPVPFMV